MKKRPKTVYFVYRFGGKLINLHSVQGQVRASWRKCMAQHSPLDAWLTKRMPRLSNAAWSNKDYVRFHNNDFTNCMHVLLVLQITVTTGLQTMSIYLLYMTDSTHMSLFLTFYIIYFIISPSSVRHSIGSPSSLHNGRSFYSKSVIVHYVTYKTDRIGQL